MITALITSLIGVLVGSLLSYYFAQKEFSRSLKIDRYTRFVEDIEKAMSINKRLANSRIKNGDGALQSDTIEKKYELEFYLQKTYAMALVSMDDGMFKLIDKIVNNEFSKKERNLIYHRMRMDLYKNTKIKYEDIMQRELVTK